MEASRRCRGGVEEASRRLRGGAEDAWRRCRGGFEDALRRRRGGFGKASRRLGWALMAMLLLHLGGWIWVLSSAELFPQAVLVPAGGSDGLDVSQGFAEFDAGETQDWQDLEDFSDFDADGSQDVDPDEAHGGLRRRGADTTRKEVRAMIRSVDMDGSGTMDFEEFQYWLDGFDSLG